VQADGDGHAEQDGRVPPGAVPRLDDAAGEFYADLPLSPLLHRVLTHSRRLLGTVAGSISLVQHDRERYFKVAEYGTSCRLGQHFTPEEGVTGQVISRRRPVILPSYREVRVGHLPAGDPAGDGAVAAVPIWWRGEVVGANVAFAGRRRRFTADEVDELEMLTQVAAAAIVRAGAADPSLAHLIRSHRRHAEAAGVQTVVTQAGSVRPVSRAVAKVAVDLVAVAGGGMTVERVPGWGTLVRADFPYLQASSLRPGRRRSPRASSRCWVCSVTASVTARWPPGW
jgi:transcriptional regulator with GAF, ATPase, and Fis domain